MWILLHRPLNIPKLCCVSNHLLAALNFIFLFLLPFSRTIRNFLKSLEANFLLFALKLGGNQDLLLLLLLLLPRGLLDSDILRISAIVIEALKMRTITVLIKWWDGCTLKMMTLFNFAVRSLYSFIHSHRFFDRRSDFSRTETRTHLIKWVKHT